MTGSDRFRVGISPLIRRADGTPVIPEFDLGPLDDDERVECVCLPEVDALDPALVASLDAAILMLEAVTPASFGPDPRLALVARFGVGYDRIDVPACTARAAALAITPDGVRRPVATTVIALMLALTLRLPEKDRLAREGPPGWARKAAYNGTGLVGRTLGALGVGNIGAEVFRLAAPLGMRFIAHDPYADPGLLRALGVEPVVLEDLFRRADVLTVHCPLSEATRAIVSAERIASMKPTAWLINTARGPVVDQAALTRALAGRRIAGAGLDVLEVEPPEAGDPILALDNVILAPHALCWTDECMAGNGAADVRAVQAVMRGAAPEHVVNREVLDDPRFLARLDAYRARFD